MGVWLGAAATAVLEGLGVAAGVAPLVPLVPLAPGEAVAARGRRAGCSERRSALAVAARIFCQSGEPV
ncbi:hypothetical protein GCM10018952_28240 [Streptosporangium vulgare]